MATKKKTTAPAKKKAAPAKKKAATTKDMWLEYVAFLKKNVPASFKNLAPGASDKTIAQLEKTIGVTLPESVKTVWRMNDGQKETMLSDDVIYVPPCIPSLSFLSTKKVEYVWKHWAKLRKDTGKKLMESLHGAQKSAVPDVIKPLYTSPKWIPLWADPTRADYIGLDLDPDAKGKAGQIINFGRNENELFQFAEDFDDLLAFLLQEVRAGNWKADVLELDDDEETEVPWFGPPAKNFYNSLLARWKARHEKKPDAPKAEAPKKKTTAKKTTAKKKTAAKKSPRAHMFEAEDLARKGKLEEAYAESLKAEPALSRDILWLNSFAEIAIKLGRFAEADQRLATRVEVADAKKMPDPLEYLYERIENILQGLKKPALAIELLKARLTEYAKDKDVCAELREHIATIKGGAKSILY